MSFHLLLARPSRLREIEQLENDRGNTSEMARSIRTLETLRNCADVN